MFQRLFLCAALLLPALLAAAAAPIAVEARGLFRDRAMLEINGTTTLLRVGERKLGVLLVAADAQQAVIEMAGERRALDLTSRVSTRFQPAAGNLEVPINPDQRGQYRVRGTINGHLLTFLVDTGASVVAISGKDAAAMGINYRDHGALGRVTTAQGTAISHSITIDVAVGALRADAVRAVVVEGDYPVTPLLGMSFLSHVGMEQRAGVLVLLEQP